MEIWMYVNICVNVLLYALSSFYYAAYLFNDLYPT